MTIQAKLAPFSIAVFIMIYPLRGGDTLGYGFLPSAAMLALVVFAFAIRPKRRCVLATPDVTTFAYLLLLLTSALVDGASDISLRYLTQIVGLSIIPYVVIRVVGFSLDDAMHLIGVFPYVTLLSAASMVVIVGAQEIFSYSGYRLGTETFNPVGIGYAFGLSAIINFAALRLKLCGLIVGGGAIAVAISILILTGSRGPMLLMSGSLLVLLLSRGGLDWRAVIALCVLAVTAYFVFGTLSEVMVFDRFANALQSASARARQESWSEALSMFAERPLFGHGLGSFEAEHGEYVHNVVFEHLANGGIILTLPLLLLVATLVRRVLQGKARRSSEIVMILALLGVYAFGVRLLSFSMANTKEVFLFLAMVLSCLQNLDPKHAAPFGKRRNGLDVWRAGDEGFTPEPRTEALILRPLSRMDRGRNSK